MLKAKIGSNAGIIWQTLTKKESMKITELKKTVKLDIKDVYLALGWLAREEKVRFFEVDKEFAICAVK